MKAHGPTTDQVNESDKIPAQEQNSNSGERIDSDRFEPRYIDPVELIGDVAVVGVSDDIHVIGTQELIETIPGTPCILGTGEGEKSSPNDIHAHESNEDEFDDMLGIEIDASKIDFDAYDRLAIDEFDDDIEGEGVGVVEDDKGLIKVVAPSPDGGDTAAESTKVNIEEQISKENDPGRPWRWLLMTIPDESAIDDIVSCFCNSNCNCSSFSFLEIPWAPSLRSHDEAAPSSFINPGLNLCIGQGKPISGTLQDPGRRREKVKKWGRTQLKMNMALLFENRNVIMGRQTFEE